MTILKRLGNLLFGPSRATLADRRWELAIDRRWETLQNVSDRYKKLGFFPLPLTQEMFERHQVFLEPGDALKAEFPEHDPRTLHFTADAGWTIDLEELEKPKDEQSEWVVSFPIKYARYEPNMKNGE